MYSKHEYIRVYYVLQVWIYKDVYYVLQVWMYEDVYYYSKY